MKGQIVMPLLRWSLACFVIYILMIVGLAIFQRRLQYFPDRHLCRRAAKTLGFYAALSKGGVG